MRFVADIYNTRAIRFEEAGQSERAVVNYRRAIRWDRHWSVPWFNLGLLFKRQRNWPESLTHNEQATALNHADEGAWWNLGIAATALGEWRKARAAWRACGIEVPDGDGPPELDFGPVPIRLNPAEDAEVVWCKRIDPARGVILNVPLPRSNHRCGDLLLHDGSQEGSRVWRGVEAPVFNELELLQPSPLGTYVVEISGLDDSGAKALIERASEEHLEAEDWSLNIRYLCKECGEGRVDHAHDRGAQEGHRTFGVAAVSEDRVSAFFEHFNRTYPTATLINIECAVPPLQLN